MSFLKQKCVPVQHLTFQVAAVLDGHRSSVNWCSVTCKLVHCKQSKTSSKELGYHLTAFLLVDTCLRYTWTVMVNRRRQTCT